jgi:hypothetical protein
VTCGIVVNVFDNVSRRCEDKGNEVPRSDL